MRDRGDSLNAQASGKRHKRRRTSAAPADVAAASEQGEDTAMARDDSEDDAERAYIVVINGEDQYSIWLADREIPSGWRSQGTTGRKAECLAAIKKLWTDMRPKSLRVYEKSITAERVGGALAPQAPTPTGAAAPVPVKAS
jgi:MbtH protein